MTLLFQHWQSSILLPSPYSLFLHWFPHLTLTALVLYVYCIMFSLHDFMLRFQLILTNETYEKISVHKRKREEKERKNGIKFLPSRFSGLWFEINIELGTHITVGPRYLRVPHPRIQPNADQNWIYEFRTHGYRWVTGLRHFFKGLEHPWMLVSMGFLNQFPGVLRDYCIKWEVPLEVSTAYFGEKGTCKPNLWTESWTRTNPKKKKEPR